MKNLVYEPSICSGCLACVINCSQYQQSYASMVSARIKIELEPFAEEHKAYYCRQCKKAACAKECPKEAIKYNQEGNYYEIDYQLCDNCQNCLKACPFEAIFFDSFVNKIIKCNTCQGDPICIKSCYTGALRWE